MPNMPLWTVSIALILIVILVEDLILMRPPGLWTAIVVLATLAVLARRGRISGSLSVSELLEEDARPGAGR